MNESQEILKGLIVAFNSEANRHTLSERIENALNAKDKEISELHRAIMGTEPMPDLRHGQFLEIAKELHIHQRGRENSIRAVGALLRICDQNGLGDAARKAMEGIGDEHD
jgi:hypothetical protein